jgi:hypothetical protein
VDHQLSKGTFTRRSSEGAVVDEPLEESEAKGGSERDSEGGRERSQEIER